MLIDVPEEDLCSLIEVLIKKNKSDRILVYTDILDIDKYPDLLLLVGNYFKDQNDYDKMFYFYNKGLFHEGVKKEILLKIGEYHVSLNRISEFYKFAEDNNFSDEMYVEVANKFFLSKGKESFVLDIYNANLSASVCERLNVIYLISKNYGQFIKTDFMLAKKYGSEKSRKHLKTVITIIFYKLSDERRDNSLFGLSGEKKCFVCKKSSDLYLTLECKHSICKDCCYDNTKEDTCLLYCDCGNKSSLLFNLLINYCNDEYKDKFQ